MNEIKLLILDDDQEVIGSFESSIKRINRDKEKDFGYKYKVYTANTLDEAKEIIKYNKLDTAIIDLNLNNGNKTAQDNSEGNQAIKELMQNFRMPIFVVSGEPEKLEPTLRDNNLIKLYPRDQFNNGFENIIPPLFFSKSIHYFARDGFLEQKINKFYWEHLSQTIKSWENVEGEYPGEIEKILSRHTLSCLNEELYVNGNVGSFDKYHPGEMYIIPPIKQHCHTGDIIEKENELFIILNPACDIVNSGNLDYFILVKVVEFDSLKILIEKINPQVDPTISFYDRLNQGGKSRYDDCKANKKDRFHYLPKFDIFDDKLIDFQQVSTKEKEEINHDDVKASISSPFLKDIIARFSAYYARQGQPNFL